jgi:hypothetical protein
MHNEVYTDHEELNKHIPSSDDNTDTSAYNFVFHYNSYTKLWSTIPRESYNDYWNDTNNVNIIRSSEINTLIDLLSKTDGNKNKLEQLINSQ